MADILSYTSLNRRRINNIVTEVNMLEKEISSYSNAQLSSMTNKFREELRNGKTINDIMPMALAVCREAIRRSLGMRPYDTQIMAAAAMGENVIAEMKTGEGKTLVQILSAYLHALESTKDLNRSNWGSIHILTANEYLADRDKKQNEKVFNLLGLSCGFAEDESNSLSKGYWQRKNAAYKCDIVYATAKTVAFDYLDDHQAKDPSARYITRRMDHAIIDEADDILLDQSSSPLILSGTIPGLTVKDRTNLSRWAFNFVNGTGGVRRKPLTCKVCDQYDKDASTTYYEDCIVFKDRMMVVLSDNLYDELYAGINSSNLKSQEAMFEREEAIMNAIAAKFLFQRNKQYTLVEVGKSDDNKRIFEVVLISDTSGRTMPQTKYRNGYQEAIEAREEYLSGGKYLISHEEPTVDRCTITYPAFAELYKTGVSGMTGTSDEEDFKDIYNMETYKVPPRKTDKRIDQDYDLYPTKETKYEAIVSDVLSKQKAGRPVLIGTTSITESDEVCAYLDKAGIKFQRLDAVYDEDESNKISLAGQKGMVTVAAKMAGRGTDIKLGEGVNELGGLYIIGTSKNKSKRIDRQLMGRCARQGQNGETKFYQSLEDELVLLRYGDYKLTAIKNHYLSLGGKIESKFVRRIVDKCQSREEGLAKEQRRLEQEIENKIFRIHREKFFEQRNQILEATPQQLVHMIVQIIKSYSSYAVDTPGEISKLKGLISVDKCYSEDSLTYKQNIVNALFYKFKMSRGTTNSDKYIADIKSKLLDVLDTYWISHLINLEEMRNTIIHTGYGGEDVLKRFEKDANELFIAMNDDIQNEIIAYSINPNLQFGEYVIRSYDGEERNHEIHY